jgi:hypothetical protein
MLKWIYRLWVTHQHGLVRWIVQMVSPTESRQTIRNSGWRCQAEKCNSYWRTSSLPNQMTCKFALLNPHVSVLEQHLDHCHQSGTKTRYASSFEQQPEAF